MWCLCVLVCDTNVGQAVMNSGLATTSQTVNSSFLFFLLILSFYVQSSRKRARLSSVETNLIPDQIFFVWLPTEQIFLCLSSLKHVVFLH